MLKGLKKDPKKKLTEVKDENKKKTTETVKDE